MKTRAPISTGLALGLIAAMLCFFGLRFQPLTASLAFIVLISFSLALGARAEPRTTKRAALLGIAIGGGAVLVSYWLSTVVMMLVSP